VDGLWFVAVQLKFSDSLGPYPAVLEAPFHPQIIEMAVGSAIDASGHRICQWYAVPAEAENDLGRGREKQRLAAAMEQVTTGRSTPSEIETDKGDATEETRHD
jgi:hypothetical protein